MLATSAVAVKARSSRSRRSSETGQVRILVERPLGSIYPSPENNKLYRPIDPSDPEIVALAESIKRDKLREPIVITLDDFILSGHRRHAACKLAGVKTVLCRVEAIRRIDDLDRFVRLLATYNKQRVKSFDEKLREEIVNIDPAAAHYRLEVERMARAEISVEQLVINGRKCRAVISAAKQVMLAAVQKIVTDKRKFWPLSDRQIHYWLFNDPPLRHASKPNSKYANDLRSYKDLCDLLLRARLDGSIPRDAIADETRPVVTWDVHRDSQTFLRDQLGEMFTGFWRDLTQSQPNHIEVIVEKNTVAPICRPICARYTLPMTSGRGYCSFPPREGLVKRFTASGKEGLVLLILSDFDPDGESIAESFARSIRDDFGVRNIRPIKVALTAEQVRDYNLPAGLKVKDGSATSTKFKGKFGSNTWELEALQPEILQSILDESIRSVLDLDAFNHELIAEQTDAQHIEGVRRLVQKTLADLDIDDGEASR